MLGERSDQRGLWEADRLYLDHVGRESFYGLLASLRGQLFRDAEFAEFYCSDNGRDSVPPSLLATALLLQSHDKVSDSEAKARDDFDRQSRVDGRNRLRSQRWQRPGRWNGQLRRQFRGRVARANLGSVTPSKIRMSVSPRMA